MEKFVIGQQVGNYILLRFIGGGGMGEVWQAKDIFIDRPVALKVINANLAGHPEVEKRSREEARILASIDDNPNIARLHTFFEYLGQPVMVMEFVDGLTLRDMVEKEGAIAPEVAVNIVRQALSGLGAAHRKGIVHRDIKPANIMLTTTTGVVKVMDFGIAKARDGARLTRTNTTIGTYCYMSPEQIRGRELGPTSDIYSMGVTLYEMLAGVVPFNFESEFDLQHAHVNTQPLSPAVHNAKIPAPLAAVVLKALEKDPDKRYPSAASFSDGLAAAVGGIPPHPGPSRRATPTHPATVFENEVRHDLEDGAQASRRSNSGTTLILGVAGAVLVAGIAAFAYFHNRNNQQVEEHRTSPPVPVISCGHGTTLIDGSCMPNQVAVHDPNSDVPAPLDKLPKDVPKRNDGSPHDVDTRPPQLPPPDNPIHKPETSASLSGRWSGGIGEDIEGKYAITTPVDLELVESTALDSSHKHPISGSASFSTASSAPVRCSLEGSTFDPGTRDLRLVYHCSHPAGGIPPFFNVPTTFHAVDPAVSTLKRGTAYTQTATANFVRGQ